MEVVQEGQRKKLPIVVTPGDSPVLFGRNWLKQLKLDWTKILEDIYSVGEVVNHNGGGEQLEGILKKHEAVFEEGLGKLKDFEVHIDLKEHLK